METTLQLYYDLLSQPARSLYMYLKLNKIPFEPHPIEIMRGEHMTNEYKQINRFQKIPCITIRNAASGQIDFKLSESIAIYRYLDQTYDIADHWYPKDKKLRARIDEYLEWQHMNTRLYCSKYFLIIFRRNLTGKPTTEMEFKRTVKDMERTLDIIENIWLGQNGQKFIASNDISVADIVAATELLQITMVGYDPCNKRPNIKKWLDLVRIETAPYFNEAHKSVYEFSAAQIKPNL